MSITQITSVTAQSEDQAKKPDYEKYRQEEAAKMKALLDAGAPLSSIEFVDLESASAAEKAFVNFYAQQVFSFNQKTQELGFLAGWYNIALDRALYENEAQKAEWIKSKDEASQKVNALVYGDAWKKTVQDWAKLSEGLTGPLADHARSLWREMQRGSIDAAMIPTQDRVDELQTKIDLLANDSEFAGNLSSVAEAISKIRQQFDRGEISLNEGAALIEKERARGEQAQSQDVGEKGRDFLHEAAVLRTKLANSKDFETWSAFQVAVQSEPYSEPFLSVQGRIEFLEGLLAKTDPVLYKLLNYLADKTGVKVEDLRESHLVLLQPDIDSFGQYFPLEQVDSLWAKAMLESGFTQANLDLISRDNGTRPGKYTHAYMSDLTHRQPKVFRVNAKKLSLELPASNSFDDWFPANIFIVQSLFSDSVADIRTQFHEGGHALHYTYEEKPLGESSAYGYVEIHSMTMENFLLDFDFLKANAKTRDGKRPTDEEIATYIRNAKIIDLIGFRQLVSRALFELKLWDYNYTADGENFVDRAVELWGQIISRGTGVHGTENHGVDSTGRGPLNAPHFRSGWVEYIGYVLAGISANMTTNTLLNRLEADTGRRSFYNQPSIAPRMIEAYYKTGFSQKFPKPVEAYTGEVFSVDSYAADFEKAVDELTTTKPAAGCDDHISQVRPD